MTTALFTVSRSRTTRSNSGIVAMSTPRVGSLSAYTLGRMSCSRESMTFCLLPPDRLSMSVSSEGVLTAICSTSGAPRRRRVASRRVPRKPAWAPATGRTMLSSTLIAWMVANSSRFFGR